MKRFQYNRVISKLYWHFLGGTAGAASLITEQLGQVIAALSFDSEYKRVICCS